MAEKQTGQPGACGEMRAALESFLAMPVREEKRRAELERLGVQKRRMNNRMALAAALVGLAAAGDVRAAKLVLDLLDSGTAGGEGGGVQIVDDLMK